MMTALNLARRVATAAREPLGDIEPAVSVLFELHRRGYWFCRVRERKGVTEDIRLPKSRALTTATEFEPPLPFEDAHASAPLARRRDLVAAGAVADSDRLAPDE
jgi:hypothetical protein